MNQTAKEIQGIINSRRPLAIIYGGRVEPFIGFRNVHVIRRLLEKEWNAGRQARVGYGLQLAKRLCKNT
jgi:hypothetical protein